MATFILEGFPGDVEVTLTPNITKEQLLGFPAFGIWRKAIQSNLSLQTEKDHAFHKDPYTLRSILVQSVDWFGKTKIGFIKLNAVIRNDKEHSLPGISFLRGGSVAMLMILRPKDSRDERLVVMTQQPRIPAGSLSFWEIPAGMVDDAGTFSGAAAKEIKEETGFDIPKSELIDLTALALQRSMIPETQTLQKAMYPSPGGSDEFIPIFLWEKELDRQEIEDLRGKLMGQRRQGEMITLRLCEYEDLWREGARDAKTLAAWALYEGLNREGVIQKELRRRKMNLGLQADQDAGNDNGRA
ncbi:nudix hydrolase 14 [Massarina eburnea CBS 473.64]|uniref:Nudix hydrolase 14 n=1 Tax=Massarina eburnea CBS 473.64 TaxID=1395130 RepID=A0A6A6S664_9PLEO|nr:nudix hydrolase 14 [Massarina eburnea CBS 473.64]